MITYEEALEIARKHLPTADNFTEYEDAFVFGDSGENSDGGFGQPVVVMKETGEVLNFVYFIGEFPGQEVISEGSA